MTEALSEHDSRYHHRDRFRHPGGPDVLKTVVLATPRPGKGQVLVQVAYAGVNRPDIIQREGKYPAPPGHSPVLGLEISGTVVALGEGVEPMLLGQKVCALVNGGGYATHCLAEASACLPVPPACRWNRPPPCPKRCSPCGTMCSNAAGRAMASGCWCMAAPAASAPWPSRWARPSGWK
jgi:hypothetical protein